MLQVNIIIFWVELMRDNIHTKSARHRTKIQDGPISLPGYKIYHRVIPITKPASRYLYDEAVLAINGIFYDPESANEHHRNLHYASLQLRMADNEVSHQIRNKLARYIKQLRQDKLQTDRVA